MDRESKQSRDEMPSSGEPARRSARAMIDRSAGTITVAVDVACPPERVYRMLVTAETERWWGSPETYAMRDWCAELRPGGSWRVQVCFDDGRRLPASGNFLEFDPPEKIVQTRCYEFDHPTLGRRETRVTYLFEPRASGARVTVVHEGFDGFEDAAIEHAFGWERVLNWLEPYTRRVNDEERRRQ
jgi:uncharacterized protein YndB with AHSA1/START domain